MTTMTSKIPTLPTAPFGKTRGPTRLQICRFPFRDGLDNAGKAGIRCVIQPGGSIRDEEVIAAADEADIAMVFTGMRHFRH